MRSLVMSFIAPDRPGLVGLVSTTIADHGGSWQESAMSRLGGQFAGILIIQVPAAERQPLIDALHKLEAQGLSISIEDSEGMASDAGQAVTLELVGHDKPGIVRDISRTLADMQINVHRMQTALTSGSMSAEQLFTARAEIRVPATTSLEQLQDRLEAIAADLMVDITLD